MNATTRNRLLAVTALLVAGGALSFIAFGNIGENLVYYWSPGELLAQGERAHGPTIRLGGVVQEKSITWNPEHTRLTFRVADSSEAGAPSVEVLSTQTPPQMFREKIGVVVEGTYDASGTFQTQRLMVNHSNEYRPPAPGETHSEDWKKSVAIETGSPPRAP